MTELYFRDLRRRVERLEARYFPEPEVRVYLKWLGEDGKPWMICGPGIDWFEGEGPPPEIPTSGPPPDNAATGPDPAAPADTTERTASPLAPPANTTERAPP